MGETRVCRSITIQEDTIAEVTETFTVTLTGNPDVFVSNDASNATVSIADNTGKFNSCIIYIHNVPLDVTYVRTSSGTDPWCFVQQLKG